MKVEIVLGIDPGFSVTGYSVLKKEGTMIRTLEYSFLKMSSTKSLQERIGIFYECMLEKIKKYQVTKIAIETPFLGKNAQTFLKLGYLRGVLYLIAIQQQIEIVEFSPTQVKQAITGFGGASKDQVAKVLTMLFPGLKMPEKSDATDALAISLCGVWKV